MNQTLKWTLEPKVRILDYRPQRQRVVASLNFHLVVEGMTDEWEKVEVCRIPLPTLHLRESKGTFSLKENRVDSPQRAMREGQFEEFFNGLLNKGLYVTDSTDFSFFIIPQGAISVSLLNYSIDVEGLGRFTGSQPCSRSDLERMRREGLEKIREVVERMRRGSHALALRA